MSNIKTIDPAEAPAQIKVLLDGIKRNLGLLPNMIKTMAHSPEALGGYAAFAGALGKSALSRDLRESLSLAVAGANGCAYCASAHSAVAKSIGIIESDDNLAGRSSDATVQAAIDFALALVNKRGRLSADDFQAIRTAGYDDKEIVEIIAQTALSIFTNYFNLAAATEIDFPAVTLPTGR